MVGYFERFPILPNYAQRFDDSAACWSVDQVALSLWLRHCFRPITLQPVWCKIFTTILKNMVYSFLSDNDFIDKKIQKGFWPKMDGVSEHTELLTHLIADGKR